MKMKDIRNYNEILSFLEMNFPEINNLDEQELKELARNIYPLLENGSSNLSLRNRTLLMYCLIKKLGEKRELFANELENYAEQFNIERTYKEISERFGVNLSKLNTLEIQLLASEVNQKTKNNENLKDSLKKRLEKYLGKQYHLFENILNSFENYNS
ncbi:MAG: hypothetical protein QXI33_01280 [Candidatus Pacearchaeota archaeon]